MSTLTMSRSAGPAPKRRRGPMTAVTRIYGNAFPAPVKRPGQGRERQVCGAVSVDGIWRYERHEDTNTTWTIEHLPTGDVVSLRRSLDAAREETAGTLLQDMQRAAFAAAFNPDDVTARAGQELLARHHRAATLANPEAILEADWRCECGGLLAEVTRDGKIGHVDACADCYRHGTGVTDCPDRSAHRFCANPTPIECGHARRNGCRELAAPTFGAGCGRDVDDCCGTCCHPCTGVPLRTLAGDV